MKKISLFLSMALTIFATTFVSCGDEQVTPDDPNNPENQANYDVYSFSETLNYNSTKTSTASAFSASSRQSVPATSASADFCVGKQSQYGVFVCSPNASLLSQCYDANGISFSSSKSTKIQNLGDVDVKDYQDVKTMEGLTVSSSYLDGKQSLGVGVNQLSNGQAIAFETSDGCKGVAKMSFSKLTQAVTITGYVAVPKNASH